MPPAVPERIAKVVLGRPTDQAFDYQIRPEWVARLVPGMRVVVEFRGARVTGLVTAINSEPAVAELKPIEELLDTEPAVPEWLLQVGHWLADYYLTGIGAILRAALPPGVFERHQRSYQITAAGRDALGSGDVRGAVRRALLEALAHTPRGLSQPALTRRLGRSAIGSTAAALIERGLIGVESAPRRRHPLPPPPLILGAAQDAPAPPEWALLRTRLRAGGVTVVHGGSRPQRQVLLAAAIGDAVAAGRGALLVTTEVRLAQEWQHYLAASGAVPGVPIGIAHGQQSERARRALWQALQTGAVRVVVTTRSAVLAPVGDPGVIAVDDEQDFGHKQEESPRWQARDVAVVRGRHQNVPVLLLAPRPSVETYSNILTGRYTEIVLSDPEPAAAVAIVSLREQKPWELLSPPLTDAIAQTLTAGAGVVLFLNRRGFSGALACRDCNQVVRCSRCSVALVFHKAARQLVCHYCDQQSPPPTLCGACRGTGFAPVGFGTERAHEVLAAAFPQARIALMDRDTGDAFPDADLLIATSFGTRCAAPPRMGLCAILDADAALYWPDFRATEATFQFIDRVRAFAAGRKLMIQTRFPDSDCIAWARDGKVEPFYQAELREREALHYPPFLRLVALTVRDRSETATLAAAKVLSAALTPPTRAVGVTLLGPAAAPMARLRGWYRVRLLLKGPLHPRARAAIRAGLDDYRRTARGDRGAIEIDVDPYDLR